MSSTNPDPPASDRRAYLRHPRTLETLWTLLGVATSDLAEGQLVDVSASGVGLLLARHFEAETALMIRLPTKTQGWHSYLVRVKRCVRVTKGLYQVGCAFVKPLAEDELQAHLL